MGACMSSTSGHSATEDTVSSRSSSMRDKFNVGPKPSKKIKQTRTRPVTHKREKGSKAPQSTSFYPQPVSSPLSATPANPTPEPGADGRPSTGKHVPAIHIVDASDGLPHSRGGAVPAQPAANDLAVAAEDVPATHPTA